MITRATKWAQQPWWLVLILATVTCHQGTEDAELASVLSGTERDQTTQALSGTRGQEVHGAVTASYSALLGKMLPVPDVSVWVEEVLTASASVKVTTDLAGRFIVPRQPPGTYRICWQKAGWVTECNRKTFLITNTTVFPGTQRIRPNLSDTVGTGIVRGTARLADGSSCWYKSELFAREEAARVELVSTLGVVLQSIRANDHGEYVLTQIPSGLFQIRARCGSLFVRQGHSSSTVDVTGATPHAITIPNRPPAVATVVAYQGGLGVRRVGAGTVVEARAESSDPDGDTLRFEWRVPPGGGSVLPSTTAIAQWTVPATPGRHSIYVLASDGKGGFAERRLTLPVEVNDVLFSGHVLGNDGPAIKGAKLTVNGVTAFSASDGSFAFSVPAADTFRLHIEAEAYAELAKALQMPSQGKTWVLTRAWRQFFDPTVDTVITDGRKDWLFPPRQEKKQRRPAWLKIFAKTLVDPLGLPADPANGPYAAYIAGFDPNDEDLPGDYGAVNLGGKEVFMVSYGAVSIDIRDAFGTKYNLVSGQSAELGSPIQDPQLSDATPPGVTIPMWTFDPTTGAWQELKGGGQLDATGTYYVAKLASFSTKNADLEKTAPGCIRIQVDAGVLALGDLNARVDVQVGTTSFQRRIVEIDDQNNALYNLPTNVPFTVELFQGVAPNDTLIAVKPGNTGAAWGGGGVPPYPFSACKGNASFTTPIAPVPFLQYGKGTGNLAQAQGYYAAIDPTLPTPLRGTLGGFWATNGFDPLTGAGGTRTSFLNDNDLGFGRDMHCRKTGLNVACYVSNYGEPDQDPGNADLAENGNQADVVATVSMEYSAVEGQDPNARIVKFYVYNGGVAASTRVESANLDKAGAKFVPNLCLMCHGGNYTPANPASPTFDEINMGSSFREFDLYTFKYPATNPQAAQEPDFLTQNQLVLDSHPSPSIQELISKFYAGGSTVDPNAVPSPWQVSAATQGLYLNVVGKSCRTCHVAQPEYDPLVVTTPAYPDWGSYTMFRDNRDFIRFLVCDAKIMPNAVVTFKNFWRSIGPHRPEFLGNFIDAATGWPTALGACTP